uniref:Uncharacterized protein n=1 Tax=Myotis myotis TaxID=51298 RepID=A0A7J7T6N2_MYOMY|nr:hypothetical protein mMyoMyo1_009185 [Myotis myotis]
MGLKQESGNAAGRIGQSDAPSSGLSTSPFPSQNPASPFCSCSCSQSPHLGPWLPHQPLVHPLNSHQLTPSCCRLGSILQFQASRCKPIAPFHFSSPRMSPGPRGFFLRLLQTGSYPVSVTNMAHFGAHPVF